MSSEQTVVPRDVSDLEEDDVVQLSEAASTSSPLSTVLRTDQRVLARVTDGIHRHPASALRERIANAYDADAALVTIRGSPQGRPLIGKIGIGIFSVAQLTQRPPLPRLGRQMPADVVIPRVDTR